MLYTGLLILHIVAGFTALLSGGISFSAPKGKRLHKRTGIIYTIAMLGVGITSLLMCVLRYSPFLFVIGVFSTYMTLTGYRSLQYHKRNTAPNLFLDWSLLLVTFILAGSFTSYMLWTEGLHLQGLQLVLLVFTGILLLMLLSDIKVLSSLHKRTKASLLLRHIGRMGGAYISTFTAFLVTNIQTEPVFIAWLLPTALGTPVLVYFIRKYSPKKKVIDKVAV